MNFSQIWITGRTVIEMARKLRRRSERRAMLFVLTTLLADHATRYVIVK